MQLNPVKERLLFLSPVVQAGWEKEASIDDFEKISELGQGAFGLVTKVRHKKSKVIYAIKQMEKKRLKLSGMIEQVKTEIKIMYSLNHENVIKLFNHFEDDDKVYLVIECAPGGQLWDKLQKISTKRIPEKEVAGYAKDLVSSLEYLHGKGIIHRDIKPENLLLGDNGQLKLADFGWSNYFKPDVHRTTFCGTLDYLAPEMLSGSHQHDHMVDVWAIGVLIYELLTGKAPFSASIPAMKLKDIERAIQQNIASVNFDYPKEFPPLARDLVGKILRKNPKTRLNLHEIKSHPWVKCNTYIVKKKELNKEALIEAATFGQNMADQKKFANMDEMNDDVPTAFTEEEIITIARPDSLLDKGPSIAAIPSMDSLIHKKVADFKLQMEKYQKNKGIGLEKNASTPESGSASMVFDEDTMTARSGSSSALESDLKKKTEECEALAQEVEMLKKETADLRRENMRLKMCESENVNLRNQIGGLQKRLDENEAYILEFEREKENIRTNGRKVPENVGKGTGNNQSLKSSEMQDLIENLNEQILAYEKLMKNQYTTNVQDNDRDKKRMIEDINTLQVLSSMKQDRINKLEAKLKGVLKQGK